MSRGTYGEEKFIQGLVERETRKKDVTFTT